MRIRSCVNSPLKKNVVVGDGEGGAEGFDLVGAEHALADLDLCKSRARHISAYKLHARGKLLLRELFLLAQPR